MRRYQGRGRGEGASGVGKAAAPRGRRGAGSKRAQTRSGALRPGAAKKRPRKAANKGAGSGMAKRRERFQIATWNVRGWNRSTADVAAEVGEYLSKRATHVVVVTETHFEGEAGPDGSWLEEVGYVWVGRNDEGARGGVGLLVRQDVAKGMRRLPALENAGGHVGTVVIK